MAILHRMFTQLIPALLLGLSFSAPLRAQLDTRLQGSTTDFLNLFQQSTNLKVKPEILTIFDFSGSMEALMFHPLFKNLDKADDDADRIITFTLTPGSPSSYTITASPKQNNSTAYDGNSGTNASASVQVTVGGSAANWTNTGTQWQRKRRFTSTSRKFLDIAISNITVTPTGTIGTGTQYTFSATVTLSARDRNGTAINLSAYEAETSAETLKGGIDWTVTGPTGTVFDSKSTDPTVTTSSTSWTSAAQWAKWTAPAITTAADPYVTATLNPKVGSTTITGYTYLTATLSSTQLVKPSGALVTKADADAAAAYSVSGQNGADFGSGDVRNWVRAASHVRFSTTVGSDTRTVDVPIPWKITERNSTGNPLSSQTVLDEVVKKGVTYGSSLNIDMDTNWAHSNGQYVFTATNGTALGNTKKTVCTIANQGRYKPGYVSWLFNGKYTDGSYAGKYVVFDAANASLAGGQGNVSWGKGYGPSAGLWGENIQVPQYNPVTGAYTGEVGMDASKNLVPALNRCQAVKRAAITTWIKHQSDVIWAFRFLDPSNEANDGSATDIDNDSTTTLDTNDPATTHLGGKDSGWVILNNTEAQGSRSTSGNSVTGVKRIAALWTSGNTPLTYAMARGLAQFTDPSSVFNSVSTGANAPSQCMNHFLILFTDGVDNNGTGTNNVNGNTAYITGAGTASDPYKFDADAGNKAVIANKSIIDRFGNNWNLFTFAGIGAHMADSGLGTVDIDYMNALSSVSRSGTPSAHLPFAIKKRGSVDFQKGHLITTMTVGVSLGGSYSDTSSPKRSLFLAAAIGDPSLRSWPDISTMVPFVWEADPGDPTNYPETGRKKSGSVYFFDANAPDKLSSDLDNAIKSAIGASMVNVTTNPNLPYIGASLGKQIYLGKFKPPASGGVMWSGDLLMFPTKIDTSGKTAILTKTGAAATTLDASTAAWSAATNLTSNRRWDARNLYTRLPGASSLSSFTYTGTAYADDTSGLKNYVATDNATAYPAGGTAQQALVKLMMGANLTDPLNSSNKTANRTTIMGDIINSAPTYLEYKWDDIKTNFPSGSTLQSSDRTRFRLILVGTNQGWLHAFGETTKIAKTEVPANSGNYVDLVSGEEDELWSFMPTDFLANLDYLNVANNSHVFMVDGSPTIYFLDLPPTTGGTGNGVLDGSADTILNPLTDTTHERAIAIIGLRKGGRSYYALNLHNPFTPTLQWSLVPDEATATNLHIRNKTGLTDAALATIVTNMGYSTCAPSIGRILFNGAYKDAVFFGGGYSIPEIEAKFSATTPPKLGRSVLAIDVYKGDILAAVDLTSTAIGGHSIGPIAAGLVPFEFFLGSGMAQRAYFTDLWGGLWAWGSKAVVSDTNSPYNDFRKDTSELQNWSKDTSKTSPYANTGIRKVYQDAGKVVTEVTTTTPHTYTFAGPVYSTLPSPFLVGTFPGKGYTNASNKTTAIPAAVGIAMVSGDRNDPLDFSVNKPDNTRLTVVFDRQDSRAWSLDSADGPDSGINTNTRLLNAGKWGASGAINSTKAYGDAVITPGSSTYYLAPSTASDTQFGYYVTFPDKQQDTDTTVYHFSKGINSPLVVAGSLFYSYFTPTTADVCTGGSGYTYSNLICDVMNPTVNDVRAGIYCVSGNKYKWVNVASDFSMLGAPGVQQAGTDAFVDSSTGKTITTMNTQTFLGLSQPRFPKARVWRTVH